MKKTDIAKKMKSSFGDGKASKEIAQGNKYLKMNPRRNGKESLNRASGRNEGDTMTLGKNENNRF